ncbi:MAG: hypothetical protein EBS60_05840 [Verrucomicrobia bacterium]|nr:hypothetical protein [Verrucomicrobiota bacterium]
MFSHENSPPNSCKRCFSPENEYPRIKNDFLNAPGGFCGGLSVILWWYARWFSGQKQPFFKGYLFAIKVTSPLYSD